MARFVTEVERSLAPIIAEAVGERWTMQVAAWLADREAAVLRFVSAEDAQSLEIILEVRDDGKQAYTRTARFNVSYLSESMPDEVLMKSVVAAVAAAEDGLAGVADPAPVTSFPAAEPGANAP